MSELKRKAEEILQKVGSCFEMHTSRFCGCLLFIESSLKSDLSEAIRLLETVADSEVEAFLTKLNSKGEK